MPGQLHAIMEAKAQSLADRADGDAGNVYGGAGHLDCERGAAAYRRLAGCEQDEATWVLTSYLVASAVILPISGWLSNRFGRKRFYMVCVVMFTVCSLLCGLAPTLPALILARVLQGLGGGGLAPSEQAILADTFPIEKRGQAFAVYGMAVVSLRPSGLRWAAGSPTTSTGTGSSLSICRWACCRFSLQPHGGRSAASDCAQNSVAPEGGLHGARRWWRLAWGCWSSRSTRGRRRTGSAIRAFAPHLLRSIACLFSLSSGSGGIPIRLSISSC